MPKRIKLPPAARFRIGDKVRVRHGVTDNDYPDMPIGGWAGTVDEREINYNFDYDYEAYEAIKRNLARLVESGHLRAAMELSLELMSQGSYQLEMSDEGLITDDIAECLQVVIKAATKSDLPVADVTAWCAEMTRQGRVDFICDGELATLAKKVKSGCDTS